MSAAPNRLSIDLGTLRTSAAVQQGGGSPAMVALGAGDAISSAVAVEGGRVVIGDAAEAVIAAHPERGVRELKRRFGDTTPVVLDGQAFTADALTAEVLTAVTVAAGVDPSTTALVLTHPAGWHAYKRELLAATGTRAGFAEVAIVSEPEAAVRPFVQAGRLAAGSTVAVYDLGGTFEVSVVGVTESGLRVLGQPQTLERLGGDVLDQVVFRHVTEALGGTLQQLDRNDPAVRAAVATLRAECAAAKERLSSDGETAIPVVAPGLDTRVRMTRDEFETAVRPLVTDTLMALDRAVASAGIAVTDLAAVVLAGGGSQVPVVAEMVAGHVGRPLLVDRPASVVALGAVAVSSAVPSAVPSTPTLAAAAPAAAAIATSAVAADAAAAAPTSTDTPSIASAPRETAMSDQPASDPAAPAAASAGAGGRAIPTPPPPPGKKVSSKVTTAVGGLAALAAAVTAAVFYGDDVVDAFDGPNGDANADGIAEAPDAETRTADRAERESGDDSMDAFDAVEPVADAPAAAAAVGTPLAPPPVDQPSVDRPAPRATHQPSQQRQESDDDGPAPRQAPAAPAAAAAGAAAAGAAAAGAATNDEFEASRAQLLARLEAFEAPEGTSPEDAQALKDELRETIEGFEPRPGQSASDAMADLRDEFDETMQDFTQDQQIEALIEETQRDNEAEGAGDATPVDPVVPPVDDETEEIGETGETGATGDIDTDGDGVVDDPPTPEADTDSDGIADDTDTPDEPASGDDTEVADDGGRITLDPGFTRIDPDLLDPVELDPSVLVGVAEVDGESTDRDHDDEIDATVADGPELQFADPNVALSDAVRGPRPGALDPTIGDAPVFEDPDAGGEVTSRFDDGFDDLIQVAVVADPDDGGEATPGTVIGGEAVPQIRATLDPNAVRPEMMNDLGDDTYEQVKAETEGDPAGILIGLNQPDIAGVSVAAPSEIDAGILLPAVDNGFQVAAEIPEPATIEFQVELPDNELDDTDFGETPGLAADLHSDITPDAPDNLQFGP